MEKRLLIGVIITDCHVDFQGEILRGIITQAFMSGCDVSVIAPLNNFNLSTVHKDCEKNIFSLILSDRFDGFIYDRNTFQNDGIRKYIDDLLGRTGKPVMLLDYNEHKSFETTTVDDCGAFEKLTDHLIDVHGLKKLYCITGPRDSFCARERLSGYFNSMKKHGLFFDDTYYMYGDFWHAAAEQLAMRIINGELERPDGIVCGNDNSAIALIGTLKRNGIRVPEDIAVTGYDASDGGYNYSPSITSYSRPNFQLGAESLRRLYRIITGRICRKVPNDNGSLRLGRSCGCNENKQVKYAVQHVKGIYRRHESDLLYRGMIFDITNVSSIEDFSDKLDNYTYLIYRLAHFKLCLTRKYIESTESSAADQLSFGINDEVRMVMSKDAVRRDSAGEGYFPVSELLDVYSQPRRYPIAYYFTPLHYNNNFFGYAALSYGKKPYSFDELYLHWINYVNVGLEQVRLKMLIKNTLSDTQRARDVDAITGLPSRSGLEASLPDPLEQEDETFVVAVEIADIQKMYFRCGDSRSINNIALFARAVSECTRDGETVGVWATHLFCIIVKRESRAVEIYNELYEKVRSPEFMSKSEWNMDFTVGTAVLEPKGGEALSDAVYRASLNKLNGGDASEGGVNPQYDKLCALRNEMMKSPELPWKINEIAGSMYLSKSYLQKIYKGFFGKSIIEEMIEFRVQKAKKLLAETDLTVTEVSRQCGYSSYNYFVRQFRSYEKMSPTEYRENCPEV